MLARIVQLAFSSLVSRAILLTDSLSVCFTYVEYLFFVVFYVTKTDLTKRPRVLSLMICNWTTGE